MDIRQFISSGIIEAYVLGVASDDDVRMLDTMAAQHPEVAQAIDEAQQAMEDYSMMHAIEPPAGLKDQIWMALAQEGMTPEATSPSVNEPAANVREFVPAQPPVVKRPYGALAAALALLIGSVVLNFMFWNRQEQSAKDLAVVRSEQQKMVAANKAYQEQLAQSNRGMQLVMDPAVKPVALAGVGTHTANQAMVYWDTRSKEVYLAMKNLPPAPKGKQYQLWAIVDGKPVDAGVYARNQQEVMQKMKVIPKAEMFAITLEQEGGSQAPTMEEMYVAGKV